MAVSAQSCQRMCFPVALGLCDLSPVSSSPSYPGPASSASRARASSLPHVYMCFSTGFTGICRCCCPPPSISSLLSHRTFPDLDLAGLHHGNWPAAQQTWQLPFLLLKNLPGATGREGLLVRECEAFPSRPGPQQPDPSCSSPFANWMLTRRVRLKAPTPPSHRPDEDGRARYLEFLQGTQAPLS